MSTASANPELLMQQILTYNHCFNGDLFHLIHVSTEFEGALTGKSGKKNSILEQENVYLFNCVDTRRGMIFHAMLQCVLEAVRIGVKFEYIYFHTSSDLLVKNDLDVYIKNFDVGATRPHILSENDHWYEKIIDNKKSISLLNAMNIDRRLKVRSEGCFFRREIFFEMIYPLLTHLGSTNIAEVANYPVEEVELSWAVEFYCARNTVKRTGGVVKNLVGRNRVASVEDIDSVASEDGVFGLKRFSSNRFDAARARVFELLGLDKDGL
ncbi:hypothetical protein [Microbulbifer sp. PSTR4-B]|uniref:hypothetical protein n=1 Tax=Microbulbifer sp. PSTR4-B TaxID=3243396 RepID=UPI00403A3955